MYAYPCSLPRVDDISVKVVNMAMEQYLVAVDPHTDPHAVAGRQLVKGIIEKVRLVLLLATPRSACCT